MAYRPGENQSFRVRPGKHKITYKATTDAPYSKLSSQEKAGASVEEFITALSLGMSGYPSGKVGPEHGIYNKVIHPTKEIQVDPGWRFYLLRLEVYESEIFNPGR